MRAIDVWVVLCYIGVFSALIEYCIILYLTKTSILDCNSDSAQEKSYAPTNQEDTDNPIEIKICDRNSKETNLKLAAKIERISRIIIISYNISFPISYFVICTSMS